MRRRRLLQCLALGFSLPALTLAVGVSPAAAVTIGQTGVPDTNCADGDWVQPPVSAGTPYTVPSTGGIVNWTLASWSHNAGPDSGQRLKVKVYRYVSHGVDYTVVGQDVAREPTPGVLNTFPANIAVKPGDVLGMTTLVTFSVGCAIPPFGETFLFSSGTDQPDGALVSFDEQLGERLNISAVVQPTNTFTLGATTRNKKRGTAMISLDLPNPGELTAWGKGVKAAALAETSKSVGAGPTQLSIKAKGKKKRKLNETGKVKLNVAVTYTPTGGDPSTQSIKVKLKKIL